MKLRRDPKCPTCGDGVDRSKIELIDYEQFCAACTPRYAPLVVTVSCRSAHRRGCRRPHPGRCAPALESSPRRRRPSFGAMARVGTRRRHRVSACPVRAPPTGADRVLATPPRWRSSGALASRLPGGILQAPAGARGTGRPAAGGAAERTPRGRRRAAADPCLPAASRAATCCAWRVCNPRRRQQRVHGRSGGALPDDHRDRSGSSPSPCRCCRRPGWTVADGWRGRPRCASCCSRPPSCRRTCRWRGSR